MPKLTFVIGATAAGKSYFIEHHFEKTDAEILNVYDYQQRAYKEVEINGGIPFGAEYRCLMKANSEILADMLKKLEQGKDVVVEHTLYKAKRRIAYLDEIKKQLPHITVEVYVISPGEERWRMNLEERDLKGGLEQYQKDAQAIEFPNPAEGFDAIYEVTDGEIKLRMDPPASEILEPARAELAEEAARIQAEDEEKERRRKLRESMNERPFWHYCEVCGKKEYITAQDAYDAGWDYPPQMGHFGLLGPRTCGSCGITDTLCWKVQERGGIPWVIETALSPEELITWRRIKGEPESLLEED